MIWRNIPKKERNEKWHTAPPPSRYSVEAANSWCKTYNSTGRYYFHYTNTRWWFENPADAIVFALHFGGR